tara:strand:+ start:191 stop:355 length:165 start_codon:yes stop_codon:yes gene_type:complete
MYKLNINLFNITLLILFIIIISIIAIGYFKIDMEDNSGFLELSKKTIFEGLANN